MNEALSASGETPEIPLQSEVCVLRSSGEIEERWRIISYFESPGSKGWPPAGTRMATVIRPKTETEDLLTKQVSVEDLLGWQPADGDGETPQL